MQQLKDIFQDGSNDINRWPDCAEPMIKEINALEPNFVLDAGCGANLYKKHITNVTGLDIATNEADYIGLIEELPYDDNSVDICLCLGSINFGSENLIRKQIQEVKRVTKPNGRLYFRVLCEHKHELYYQWNLEKAKQFRKEFDFTFIDGPRKIYKSTPETRYKVGDRGQERLYWVWKN